MPPVISETDGSVAVITINRPECRNAVDAGTANQLAAAFRAFDADGDLRVAVLTGRGGSFCAGADLKGIADGRPNRVELSGDAPMGPTRMLLSKPVVAAIEGHAVAGGLELAIWCDLRVAGRDAVFGVFSRRFGVPLVDGGTVRLPRLIGQSRALDMILTGRGVDADEAFEMGLVNRVVPTGGALTAAIALAHEVAAFPPACLHGDRMSVYEQWPYPMEEALMVECRGGIETLASGEAQGGATRFVGGAGRHGSFEL
ncbi:MAG: crotonase/enoyl-CoA hydratase family protein [Acidimicrobiales bacterium]